MWLLIKKVMSCITSCVSQQSKVYLPAKGIRSSLTDIFWTSKIFNQVFTTHSVTNRYNTSLINFLLPYIRDENYRAAFRFIVDNCDSFGCVQHYCRRSNTQGDKNSPAKQQFVCHRSFGGVWFRSWFWSENSKKDRVLWDFDWNGVSGFHCWIQFGLSRRDFCCWGLPVLEIWRQESLNCLLSRRDLHRT